jgi:hypothetical protein
MAGMETVNSNNKQLPGAEIVIKAVEQIGGNKRPIEDTLAMIKKEGTLPTADITQFGNTVFLGNRGKGDNKHKMLGKAFNVDTGKNYINNVLDYLEYLREKGITHYRAAFKDSEVLKLMQFIRRVLKDTDSNIHIARVKDGSYVAFVKLGSDSIPRAF